jgi:hypothetical protein
VFSDVEFAMEETSHSERADMKTRWKKGQSGNPKGRALSREEEQLLLYPNWPHIFPYLKKVSFAGDLAGNSAGRESPDPETQAIDSTQDFGSEKISRENPPPGAGRKDTLH